MSTQQKVLILLSIIFIIGIPASFGQTYNCVNGCTVTVTPNSQTGTSGSNSGSNLSGPSIGGFNIPDAITGAINWIQNAINGLISSGIGPDNKSVNATGIVQANNYGFQAWKNLSDAGFSMFMAITSFFNSFYGVHVSIWLIIIISTIITIVLVIKNGENMFKRSLIVILIVAAIIIIIPLLGLQNSILSNLP